MTSYEKNFSSLLDDANARFRGPAITRTTWQGYLNEVYVKLQGTMREFGDYDLTATTIAVTNGTQEYDLPADFGIARKVWRGDDNVQLEKTFYDNWLLQYVSSQTSYSRQYYVRGAHKIYTDKDGEQEEFAQIGLCPCSDRSFTLGIIYQPAPHKLENGTDIPVVPPQFVDLIVWGALVNAYTVEGMSEQQNECEGRFERLYKDFKQWLGKDREAYSGQGFQNVWRRFSG